MSSQLEKAHKVGQGSDVQLPSVGKLKREALKLAGLSTSTANRCEQLAKIPEQEFEDAITKVKDRGQVPHSTQFVRQLSAKRKNPTHKKTPPCERGRLPTTGKEGPCWHCFTVERRYTALP